MNKTLIGIGGIFGFCFVVGCITLLTIQGHDPSNLTTFVVGLVPILGIQIAQLYNQGRQGEVLQTQGEILQKVNSNVNGHMTRLLDAANVPESHPTEGPRHAAE